MNTIYIFDVCAIAVIGILILTSIHGRHIHGRTNRIFLFLLCAIVTSTVAEVTGSMSEVFLTPGSAKYWIVLLSNYLYFVARALLMPLFLLYMYSSTDLWHVYKRNRILTNLISALVGFDMLLLLLNGWAIDLFSVDQDGLYVRGSWMVCKYVVALIFAIWLLIAIVRYRKLINIDKFMVLLLFYITNGIGVGIQIVYPYLSTESLGVAISLLFYMVVVKREENQVDPVTGASPYYVGIKRIANGYQTGKPQIVLFLKIVNLESNNLYLGHFLSNEYQRIMYQRIQAIAVSESLDADIYYLNYGLYGLIAEPMDSELINKACRRMLAEAGEPIEVGGLRVNSKLAMCIVRCPEDLDNVETIITLSNTFYTFLEEGDKLLDFSLYRKQSDYFIKARMGDIIRRALADNSFEIFYQPIYSVREKRYVSAEGLIRLRDPEYGYLSPAAFLPIAERTGYIHEIGEYVTREIADFVVRNDIKSLGLDYIEMNLSASQCLDSDISNRILEIFDEKGVSPKLFCMGITETVAEERPEVFDKNLKKLREAGVKFAIDDYGTGYSNIKRILKLPVDQIKIDRSFVENIEEPDNQVVIAGTIQMFKDIGKEVIIEGVEAEETAKIITDMDADLLVGCHLIQGFYYCTPLPEKEFLRFIESHV